MQWQCVRIESDSFSTMCLCRMLMYTGHNHSLLSIDTESDRYMNLVLWIIQHLSLGSRHGCAEQK